MSEDLQLSADTLAALKAFASSRGIIEEGEEEVPEHDILSRVRK